MLARSAARGHAWSLAQEVYLSPRLRPHLDEGQARVFAGEDAPPGSRTLSELAETREAVVDDGAASRRLLGSLAKEYGLEGVFVVVAGGERERPLVRVFVASAESPAAEPGSLGRFDAVELRAESGPTPWAGARTTLERLAPPAPPQGAVALAKAPAPSPSRPEGKSFYESPWFWGAAGAAAVLGGAFFLATRDSSSDSIHLQMQVPR